MGLPANMKIYGMDFKFYSDQKLQAYYHTYLEAYSTKLNRNQYICHIILLAPFKISNYQTIYTIEEQSLNELFADVKTITKDNAVFSLIVEFTEGASIVPDLNLLRSVNKSKHKIERKMNVTLNHAVAIVPKKYGKTFKLFKMVASYFSKGEEMAIVVNKYEEAIEKINNLDHFLDSKAFEKNIR